MIRLLFTFTVHESWGPISNRLIGKYLGNYRCRPLLVIKENADLRLCYGDCTFQTWRWIFGYTLSRVFLKNFLFYPALRFSYLNPCSCALVLFERYCINRVWTVFPLRPDLGPWRPVIQWVWLTYSSINNDMISEAEMGLVLDRFFSACLHL